MPNLFKLNTSPWVRTVVSNFLLFSLRFFMEIYNLVSVIVKALLMSCNYIKRQSDLFSLLCFAPLCRGLSLFQEGLGHKYIPCM